MEEEPDQVSPMDVMEKMKQDIEEMKKNIEKATDEMKQTFDLALRKIMVDREVDSVAVRKELEEIKKKVYMLSVGIVLLFMGIIMK